ncbi:glycosyltransferase family 2 protein [Hoeflea marina]|nr:glycosyltransferase family 2 protein [Hoeflea marina]
MTMIDSKPERISAIVPCYHCADHIVAVVSGLLPYVERVYVIDDKCSEGAGRLVVAAGFGEAVTVIFHDTNLGVGGAVMTGYSRALADGMDIMIKVDGDGQMDPANIPALVAPILQGRADYTKGNRFFSIEDLERMPKIRLVGNAALSFVSKVSSGYWDVMDPTNGFTAIHRSALAQLPLGKISTRFFFESDMLFRLYLARAVVRDVPMRAIYGEEISTLNIRRVLREFPKLYLRNFFKRFVYSYLMRDFNVGSIETVTGLLLFGFGTLFGLVNWISYGMAGVPTPVGTIMIASLPVILGAQLLLAALAFDVSRVPTSPISSQEHFRS